MRVTQWGEYGIHCAVFLAEQAAVDEASTGAQHIAEVQGLALDYTQQILQRLRRGGIIQSVRGPQGGYRLARPATEITLHDILVACEGDTFEVICDTKPVDLERCDINSVCGLRSVWHELKTHVDVFLTGYTLERLVASKFNAGHPTDLPVKIRRPSLTNPN